METFAYALWTRVRNVRPPSSSETPAICVYGNERFFAGGRDNQENLTKQVRVAYFLFIFLFKRDQWLRHRYRNVSSNDRYLYMHCIPAYVCVMCSFRDEGVWVPSSSSDNSHHARIIITWSVGN